MDKKEIAVTLLFFLVITAVFFNKIFLNSFIPFPGDLLMAEYQPWRSYSYLGYNPGSVPNKAQYFDTLRQLYPWKTFTVELLKHGEIPLWNPYNFSGYPLLANFQSAVFYPLNLFYLVFSQISAWTILIVLQPLLAIIFTYFYARKINLSKLASIFSAVSFGFSHFFIVWLEYNTVGHVILWLPLTLLAVESLLKKISIKWQIVFIASLLFSLLAGHIQVFFYELVFVLIYGLFRGKAKLGNFGILTGIVLGIGAIQIIPGLELIGQSARSAIPYNVLIEKILIQPWQLIMLIASDFFGNPATRNYWPQDTYVSKVLSIGVISLLFIISSIFQKKKSGLRNFFIIFSIIILLLVTSNPITRLVYKINLPFLSSSSPTLMTYLLVFFLSILAGIGLDSSKKNIAKSTIIMVLIFCVLWIIIFKMPHSDVARRNLMYSSIIFGASLPFFLLVCYKKKAAFFAILILLSIHLGDRFYSFTKFNPIVPKDFVFPQTEIIDFLKKETDENRFWGYGSARIEANFATQEKLYSTDGYDPLYPKRYGEFIQSSENGRITNSFSIQTRSDAFIAPGFGEEDLPTNKFRLRVLDILGVKYILDRVENASTQKTFPPERFKLVYENENSWRVFDNLEALPRAFLVYDYEVFNSKKEFENLFFDENFDPRETVLLEEKPNKFDSGQAIEQLNNRTIVNNVQITKYTPNVIEIDAQTSHSGLLFLSDVFFPGWTASIDGKEEKILRANYAFRAVQVKSGNYKVIFSYKPKSFQAGFLISMLSLMLVFPTTLLIRKYA